MPPAISLYLPITPYISLYLEEDAARDRGEHDVRRLQHRDDVQRVVLAEGGVEPVQPEANGHRRV